MLRSGERTPIGQLGTVTLVGAGPGDPELLTLRAARALSQADAVLYDRLVAPEILALAPAGAERIYVGKEAGKPCRSQAEVNALLVAAARRFRRVVRLKGGDPFVFGRGSEEALFLREHGVRFEIVPGVSSAIAAAAYAGIPVTHRNVACSFAVVTGHESSGKQQDQVDFRGLSGVDTVVVLMGVGRRQEIARELLAGGRRGDEPVAFVEHATTAEQKVVRATLAEVAARPPHVASPAVMVVGEVVALGDQLGWFAAAPAVAPEAEERAASNRRAVPELLPPSG